MATPSGGRGGASAPQTQSKEALLKSYTKRLKDDVRAMVDNYAEILRLCKFEDDGNVLSQVSRQTQGEMDGYEMQVRASNVVRAGESLMNLVSDIKQFLILNDFPSTNDSIVANNRKFRASADEMDAALLRIRDEMCSDLFELEEEYYLSMYK